MSTRFFFRFFLLIQLVRDPNVYFKKLFRVVKFSCTNMNRGKMKNYRIIKPNSGVVTAYKDKDYKNYYRTFKGQL